MHIHSVYTARIQSAHFYFKKILNLMYYPFHNKTAFKQYFHFPLLLQPQECCSYFFKQISLPLCITWAYFKIKQKYALHCQEIVVIKRNDLFQIKLLRLK